MDYLLSRIYDGAIWKRICGRLEILVLKSSGKVRRHWRLEHTRVLCEYRWDNNNTIVIAVLYVDEER